MASTDELGDNDAFGITGAPDLLVSKMNVVDSGVIKKINS